MKVYMVSYGWEDSDTRLFANEEDAKKWDVSKVKDMQYMFYNCKEFNCNLSKWNVHNVVDEICFVVLDDIFKITDYGNISFFVLYKF